ncbi:hypothetical protein BT69DRAFT_1316350 [Atractiella rhizophila]|nr:hypothetical protein BT69DRAFT_1316350 [Atractiella rhizophila]
MSIIMNSRLKRTDTQSTCFRLGDLPPELQLHVVEHLYFSRIAGSTSDLLAFSLVSRRLRSLVIPFLFETISIQVPKELTVEPLANVLPPTCILAAKRVCVRLERLWTAHYLRHRLSEFLHFPDNNIRDVNIITGMTTSILGGGINTEVVLQQLMLVIQSSPSVHLLALENEGTNGFGLFNHCFVSMQQRFTLHTLVLKSPWFTDWADIVAAFPLLQTLLLHCCELLAQLDPYPTFPPLRKLEIIRVRAPNQPGWLSMTTLQELLSTVSSSLETLSIRHCLITDETKRDDTPAVLGNLKKLNRLELFEIQRFYVDILPIDVILERFAASTTTVLVLEQLVQFPEPDVTIEYPWAVAFPQSERPTDFEFQSTTNKTELWAYALHLIAYQKRRGDWKLLQEVVLGSQISATVWGDADHSAVKYIPVLKELGIHVRTHKQL